MSLKSGFKTSEFWLGIILFAGNALADVLIAQNIITAEERETILKLVMAAVLGIVSIVIHISYTMSRTEVKKSALESNPELG